MVRAARLALVGGLVLALSGCTAWFPVAPAQPGAGRAATTAESASDVGNERPAVSFDGLMVRRRVVIAIHPEEGADLVALREDLNQAAARDDLVLSEVSPDVLDAVLLEHLVPEVIVMLPDGSTIDDAGRLIDPASYPGGVFPRADHFHVGAVLVHDLRFSIRSDDPRALADAIAREGILADALGNYATASAEGVLSVAYTGPLRGDAVVDSVRAAIARPAGVTSGAVAVGARTAGGVGVDMATEPPPSQAGREVPAAHDHG